MPYSEGVIAPSLLLKQAKTPAFLVSSVLHIRYLTGLPLTAGLLLVTPRKYLLFVDSRYTEAAQDIRGVVVCPIGEISKYMQRLRSCGFESNDVTAARLQLWKRKWKGTRLVPTTEVIEYYRRTKRTDERAALRTARTMTQAVLRAVPQLLKPGMTELELARKIHILVLEQGGDGLSFETIVAFGSNSSRPHHRPTARTLRSQDIVQIDMGVKYRGYCADMSEVFFMGKPTADQQELLELLHTLKRAAMRLARAGTDAGDLDRFVRSELAKHKLEEFFTHALGHGVGLDVHEGVILSKKAPKTPLLAKEVIAIEPGVYFPGKYGMRVEDMKFVA